jgi:outer membrane receptor protein involved in Fe transport
VAKEYLFRLSDYSTATWGQSERETFHFLGVALKILADFVASIAGAVASITVAAPLDVVKTRIQNAHFNSNVSGVTIIRDMVRQEGIRSFFKGLTPKVGPAQASPGTT